MKHAMMTAAVTAAVALSGCATNGYNDPYYGNRNNTGQAGRAVTGAVVGAGVGAVAGAVLAQLPAGSRVRFSARWSTVANITAIRRAAAITSINTVARSTTITPAANRARC